ncbi:long-chain-fatty-acid--CoA ligase [Plastoroseomonas hellenica]|uniref:long-chain-fatty-acid--CoA ligase n=1 Tax=Plastoroseomonas hellenica TaxID=2687306 RepID=UPI001BAAE1DE|nr:long-chain fatty acid--CoA ligase [Plastoroseomonas hellenica]MBR0643206.1 long-chain fatty acid--CoA ligase [Plastoroseomonas hellenica]
MIPRAYPPDIAWDMPLPRETLTEVLEATVAAHGEKPALEFMGRSWRYAELGDMVARVAAGLRALGVAPGDRVGLCLPNTHFFVAAYFGVLKAGAVVVNFSPLMVAEEMAAQVADSGTSVMLTLDLKPLLPRVLEVLDNGGPLKRVVVCRFAEGLPAVKSVMFRLVRRASIAAIPHDPRITEFAALLKAAPITDPPMTTPEGLAVLQYTGGTTGRPKGVMLSHANLCANLRQLQAWCAEPRRTQERMLAVIPFFHVFAMTVAMNLAIAIGAEIVMQPRYEKKLVLAALRRRHPTMLPGVPTLFKALLDHGATREDLAQVRACISGGAPLPIALKHEFEAKSGAALVEGYGLTEASPVCFCNPLRGENREGTIGLPLPLVEAEIRSLEDPARAVPVGERGELCIRGPNVMTGYRNRPAETAATMTPDGWLRTGDVGIMDADGYVALVDRIKDLILVSGFNVYPRAIEEVLYTHPDVAAATVVGIPDPRQGESPAAFVELKPGAVPDEAALRAFLKQHLSAIQMPKLIEFREALPRTAVGKLSKKELREEIRTRLRENA